MAFNSLAFFLFLPAAFALHWLAGAKNRAAQNAILIAASYVFYGWVDWRLPGLVAFSTLAFFGAALGIERAGSARAKRAYGLGCVALALGLLGYFKYANFFTAGLADALRGVGVGVSWPALKILLPAGISFYIFKTLGYALDVWHGKMRATRDLAAFAAYAAFFPQLLAGPIESARRFLPQFLGARRFDVESATDGCRQMLWGFFKKAVVAEACAPAAVKIFNHWDAASPPQLALGAALFAFQIYADFSGYSDIAEGCGRLFGFDTARNFATPYFSRDIAEFWRRWHISLTTWFREHVYIPLGGSRRGKWRALSNTLAVFCVSGLWHGANWTFVAWGLFHGLLFAPLLLLGRNRRHVDGVVAGGRHLPRPTELFSMLATFALVCVGWVFFNAKTVGDACGYLARMATGWGDGGLAVNTSGCWWGVAVMLAVEWRMRGEAHGLRAGRWPGWSRWLAYAALGVACLGMFKQSSTFIYFQF